MLALALVVSSSAHALNVGYYEMCDGQGSPTQVTPINGSGHTAINLTDLTAASLAGVDVIFVNNCSNFDYGAEYLSRLAEVEAAVAAGKVLMIHDRYVTDGELILPGGASFDVVRDENVGVQEIEVIDDSTIMTSGPAGTITDATLDGGCHSNHGFTVAGTLPGDARVILTRNDVSRVVTFAYGFGAGVVIYSSIPLDYYLGSATCGPSIAMRTIYAVNSIAYAASLSESVCGDGALDPGETCDLGAANNGETCCRFDCTVRPAGSTCRESVGSCDPAELCDGLTTICPADDVEPAGTVCRSATGVCDVAELCDGASSECPVDEIEPAGTVCRAATDDCDLAEVCDGASTTCPVDAVRPDTDGDTVCDLIDNCDSDPNPLQQDDDLDQRGNACDACTNVATSPARPSTVVVTKQDTAPGDDALSINMTILFLPATPTLDPLTNGVRISVEDLVASNVLLDATIPGGAYSKVTKTGWRINRAGTVFTYKNASPAPPADITGIVVKRLANGKTKVSVRGKKGSYPIPAPNNDVRATIVLDPPTAETGQCVEGVFFNCTRSRTGARLACKL